MNKDEAEKQFDELASKILTDQGIDITPPEVGRWDKFRQECLRRAEQYVK